MYPILQFPVKNYILLYTIIIHNFLFSLLQKSKNGMKEQYFIRFYIHCMYSKSEKMCSVSLFDSYSCLFDKNMSQSMTKSIRYHA